ncbi:uncharacterized protein L201_002585 [Kwoniella dendrophila CBS 6074]|uniref:Uncharacterized protein n=1 Tax=Kwoniella dendrophila CBS 6074 TaxID=1295534 RepID=A0AAX4JS17_9TREE
MEAIRPSPPKVVSQQHFQDDIDVLPPPPEPFPSEQAVGTSTSSSASISRTKNESSNSKQKTYVRAHLSSVQQSCINALSSLLPSSESKVDNVSRVGNQPSSENKQLVTALTDLLEVTYELDDLLPPSTNITPSTVHTDSFPNLEENHDNQTQTSFNALTYLLEELQQARLQDDAEYLDGNESQKDLENSSPIGNASSSGLHPAINAVREELAWQRLDSLSTAIISLSKTKNDSTFLQRSRESIKSSITDNGLPPSYEQHVTAHSTSFEDHNKLKEKGELQNEDDNASILPSYDDSHSLAPESQGPTKQTQENDELSFAAEPTGNREKMLMELDSLTSAIERLSSVSPRLHHDQRVALRNNKTSLSKTDQTLGENSSRIGNKLLSKEDKIRLERQKMKELEEIWDKIERAHGKRRIKVEDGQRAEGGEGWENRSRERFINRIVDQAEASRLESQDSVMGDVDAELARARELRNRDHFLRDLIDQSEERRLDDQDASEPTTSRKASLIEDIMDYSTSGRLKNQDFILPTPRNGPNGEKIEDPLELVTVQDFLSSQNPSRRESVIGDALHGESSEGMARSRSNSVGGSGKKSTSGRNTPTAFKKVAGMLRRGSGPQGLKSSNGLDINNIAFVAEHQENLRSVQITLHGIGVSSNLELQVETTNTDSEEAIITSKKDPTISTRIALPVPVQPGQSVFFTPQSLHLEAKLNAQPIPPAAVSLLPAYPLSAPDLRNTKAKSLCCTSCERELSTLPFNDNIDSLYKDLPSEHWSEMMEIWMCHNDPSFTAQLAEQTKIGFWPKDGSVLVGASYLLIGKERVNWNNINVDITSGEQDDAWNVITCICGEVLGKQRSQDAKAGAGTVRFSKWAIALSKEADMGDHLELVRFPLSVFVVSDMLELSQAHASHRFIVSDEESGNKRIYIWLFNQSVKMSYTRPTESSPLHSPLRISVNPREPDDTNTRRSSVASTIGDKRNTISSNQNYNQRNLRAAKVMYKVVENNNENDLDKLPGFGIGNQIETLSYPTNICDRLVTTLKESSTIWPINKRSMGLFDIGFLERL